MARNWWGQLGNRWMTRAGKCGRSDHRLWRRRRELTLQELESRVLLAVSASEAAGLLNITLGAVGDTATVAVSGTSSLTVTGTGYTSHTFTSVTGVTAMGNSLANQSITFGSTPTSSFTLSKALTVSGLTSATITDNYHVTSASVSADNIAITGGSLIAPKTASPAGNVSLTAGDTETSTTAQASAQVTLTNATIQGDNITIAANGTLTVTTNGNGVAGANLATVNAGTNATIAIA